MAGVMSNFPFMDVVVVDLVDDHAKYLLPQ